MTDFTIASRLTISSVNSVFTCQESLSTLNCRLSVLLMLPFLADVETGMFSTEPFSIRFQKGCWYKQERLSETVRIKLGQNTVSIRRKEFVLERTGKVWICVYMCKGLTFCHHTWTAFFLKWYTVSQWRTTEQQNEVIFTLLWCRTKGCLYFLLYIWIIDRLKMI